MSKEGILLESPPKNFINPLRRNSLCPANIP
jgi:hypothetical protein